MFDFQGSHGHLIKDVNAIVNGRELTDADLEGKEDFFTAEELASEDFKTSSADPLSDYCLKILQKNPMIKEGIKAHDEPILKHLTGIDAQIFEDNDNYELKFHFSENEWFTNSDVTVTVVVDEDESEAKEIKCSGLNWKEGKNVTEKTITKKQKNKRTGQNRTVTKTQKQDSFFMVFKDYKNEEEDDEEEGDEDKEAGFDSFENISEILGSIHENLEYFAPIYYGVKVPQWEEEPEDDFEDDDEDEDDEEYICKLIDPDWQEEAMNKKKEERKRRHERNEIKRRMRICTRSKRRRNIINLIQRIKKKRN